MRKSILLLLIIATTFSFTSCDKDDDVPQDQIIGAWKRVEEPKSVDSATDLDECFFKATIEFTKDGNVLEERYGRNTKGVCELQETTSYVWKKTGENVYTLTFEGKDTIINVTFQSDKMIVQVDDNRPTTLQRK